jgi:hypothetical protein
MRKLNEIAADLRDLLGTKFQTVRISAMQNPGQLIQEIKAINPEKLPGVIVAFESLKFNGTSMTNTERIKLILVDQFRAAADQRALSVFQAAGSLLELFPADGREINGVWYYPADCAAASPDPQFAALAVGLEVKQGSV